MSKYVWLSFPLGLDDPRPPAIPAPELTPFLSIENDGANVQILRLASHTGTHVDSPLHVAAEGIPITDYRPEEFIFTRPAVVDLAVGDSEVVVPEHLEPLKDAMSGADIVLFRFGWGGIRKAEPERFIFRSPGFGVESARWIRESLPKLRAIGMDVPSLACIARLEETMAAHNELLAGQGNRFLAIEDMDLDKDLSDLREVRISPWLVSGMDSGPCSVVGVVG
jgi:kynurenine formamidase